VVLNFKVWKESDLEFVKTIRMVVAVIVVVIIVVVIVIVIVIVFFIIIIIILKHINHQQILAC